MSSILRAERAHYWWKEGGDSRPCVPLWPSACYFACSLATRRTGQRRVARRLRRPEPRHLYCFCSRRTTSQPLFSYKRNSAGGNLRKRQRGRLVGRVRLLADRRRGSDYAFVLKWVLANSKNRSKLEEIRKLSPERAIFSLVARSANQGFFRREI